MSTGLQRIWPKHKVLISTIIGAIVVILASLIVAGRSSKAIQAAPRPRDVEVARVEQRDVPVYS